MFQRGWREAKARALGNFGRRQNRLFERNNDWGSKGLPRFEPDPQEAKEVVIRLETLEDDEPTQNQSVAPSVGSSQTAAEPSEEQEGFTIEGLEMNQALIELRKHMRLFAGDPKFNIRVTLTPVPIASRAEPRKSLRSRIPSKKQTQIQNEFQEKDQEDQYPNQDQDQNQIQYQEVQMADQGQGQEDEVEDVFQVPGPEGVDFREQMQFEVEDEVQEFEKEGAIEWEKEGEDEEDKEEEVEVETPLRLRSQIRKLVIVKPNPAPAPKPLNNRTPAKRGRPPGVPLASSSAQKNGSAVAKEVRRLGAPPASTSAQRDGACVMILFGVSRPTDIARAIKFEEHCAREDMRLVLVGLSNVPRSYTGRPEFRNINVKETRNFLRALPRDTQLVFFEHFFLPTSYFREHLADSNGYYDYCKYAFYFRPQLQSIYIPRLITESGEPLPNLDSRIGPTELTFEDGTVVKFSIEIIGPEEVRKTVLCKADEVLEDWATIVEKISRKERSGAKERLERIADAEKDLHVYHIRLVSISRNKEWDTDSNPIPESPSVLPKIAVIDGPQGVTVLLSAKKRKVAEPEEKPAEKNTETFAAKKDDDAIERPTKRRKMNESELPKPVPVKAFHSLKAEPQDEQSEATAGTSTSPMIVPRESALKWSTRGNQRQLRSPMKIDSIGSRRFRHHENHKH